MDDYLNHLDPDRLGRVESFIHIHWKETVRFHPDDEGTLIGLPFPYTVPCRKGTFQELYYWDTYFTSVGLIYSEQSELALGNLRNLLHLVQKFGFVPNGNRTYYLNRSQPPYLCALVETLAETLNLPDLRIEALPALQTEYRFWTEHRSTPTGLCRYGNHAKDSELLEFYLEVAPRTGLTTAAEESLPRLRQIMAECESGADFTSRFDSRCPDFCPVDLNCLLHGYELFFAHHSDACERSRWEEAAEYRRHLINDLCWDEERGGFFDYDWVHTRRSTAVTAWLHPLWTGIATPDQAQSICRRILPRLEFAFGLSPCARQATARPSQWDFPNGWPCLQFIAYAGFLRYGFTDVALRIARKYLATVARNFDTTGDLWEKYNVEDGTTRSLNEPGYCTENSGAPHPPVAPAMMGWSAGVFLDALALHHRHA